MRHIFHTCLLAIRLISTVNNTKPDLAQVSLFGDIFVDDVFKMIYVDPVIVQKRNFYAAYKVEQENLAA
jgi:hypothetical protein